MERYRNQINILVPVLFTTRLFFLFQNAIRLLRAANLFRFAINNQLSPG
jgi:hypothetical protein